MLFCVLNFIYAEIDGCVAFLSFIMETITLYLFK